MELCKVWVQGSGTVSWRLFKDLEQFPGDCSRIWNSFLETGKPGQRPGQARRRTSTPKDDRYLTSMARRRRNMNVTLIQQQLLSTTWYHSFNLNSLKPIPHNRSVRYRIYLYIIWNGARTGRQYRNEILRPNVVPYAATIGDNMLMDDNCTLHR